jgi:hypothetical protein
LFASLKGQRENYKKKRMKEGKGQLIIQGREFRQLIIQGREFRQLKIHLPWN